MSVCPKLRTISLSLDKAPSWQVHGPSLRHMCLQIPPSTTIERGRLEDFEDASEIIPSARHLYSFKEMSGMHSNNLPNLQTLFLQGLREPVEVRGIDFHDSNTLEVIDVHDCWISDLSVPPTCRVFVSAQSSFFIAHMDGSREHPLVSKALHVRLPTDLGDYIHKSNRFFEQPPKYVMGIPDMFPAMRTLRMTTPNESFRCNRYCSFDDRLECFPYTAYRLPAQAVTWYADMGLHHMKCLSRHWQHVNLRELIVDGKSLGVTIPALPNLETLLVVCTRSVALDFVDAASLGCTITNMSVTGKDIHFHKEQRQELCIALKARDLALVGDWWRCIAVRGCNDPVCPAEELHRQAVLGLACRCKACPACLGIA